MNKDLSVKQEKDLEKCHDELYELILSFILFLNSNGTPITTIKKVISVITDSAFNSYEKHDLRKRFREDFEKWIKKNTTN